MSSMEVSTAAGPEALASKDDTSTVSPTASSNMDFGIPADLILMDSPPISFSQAKRTSEDMNYHWRKHINDGLNSLQPQVSLQPSHADHFSQSSWNFNTSYQQIPRSSANTNGETVPMSSIVPGPVYPTETQMKFARLYGLRRKNGSYVPLIPVDELHGLDFSRLQCRSGAENMIVLPELQLPVIPRAGEDDMVPASLVKSLLLNCCHHPDGAYGAHVGGAEADEVQKHINSIVATSPLGHRFTEPRRHKIYCDKWIHEGICAFTQLGCKYKHEMPMDKKTQLSLGLNNGIPKWYKQKQQARFQRADSHSSPGSAMGSNSSTSSTPYTQASWRNNCMTPVRAITDHHAAVQSYNFPNFGPIAPPLTSYHSRKAPITNGNLFDTLRKEDWSEEEGEIFYERRR
ncbi:hypothetical protein BJ878DRAFT_297554 [Calycina marina]|uniref:C3H1-type domain-containing protein n=1 Tax=Calycina marina TaxID=1763456 RepID=A0A9P8CGX4_9HELO|nr:hypothetical protein BJ878DRAFT_297554 [Calycina marina]